MGVRAARTRGQSKSPAKGDPGRRHAVRRGRPIAGQDIPAILQAIARTAARLCDASNAHIYRLESDQLRLEAIQGSEPERSLGQAVPVTRELPSGCAVLDRRTIHVRNAQSATAQRRYPGLTRIPHLRTMLAMPLLRDGVAVGLIIIWRARVRPFTAKQIALLRTFADQAAIALENERLAQALAARNSELTEALEQQTATSEILRVISSSPTDIQPVFDTIVRSAATLCAATAAGLFRFDGSLIHLGAYHNWDPEMLESVRQAFPRPPGRGTLTARAILSGQVMHVRGHCRRPGVRRPEHRPGWISKRALGADDPGRHADRRHHGHASRGQAVLGHADRAAEDLRRPGRHRHRERPALPGAGGPESRSHRVPRAADGDQRDPARHLELAHRRPARVRHDRAERRQALRRPLQRRVPRSTAS